MRQLSDFTSARVALGQTGDSLPTAAQLEFRLAHARARDAVHLPLDVLSLQTQLDACGWPSRVVASQAVNRHQYLLRPDLGRSLSATSEEAVDALPKPQQTVIALADGLSAAAIHRHAVPLLQELHLIGEEIGLILLIQHGRVAIGDHIGGLLDSELCVLMIGERPGLSSPDSLGAYLTWRPRRGCTDAQRNCVSNIHDQGLGYQVAAQKIAYLIGESRRMKLTGVGLKERTDQLTAG